MADPKPEEKKPEEKPTPPAAPHAKEKAAQAPKQEGKPMPLPMQDVIGTPQEQIVRNWNAQAKAGIIFQCKETGCYHPLIPVRDANNQPVVYSTRYRGKGGKELVKTEFVMTCTYHPDHGSTITLPPGTVVLKEGQRLTSVVGFRMPAPTKEGDDLDMT